MKFTFLFGSCVLLESSFFVSGRAAVTEHYLRFGCKGSVKCDIEQSRTRQPLLKHGYLGLYLTSPFGNFAGNRSVINFREAVAAREKAETAEEIQHLLATFTERGEVWCHSLEQPSWRLLSP